MNDSAVGYNFHAWGPAVAFLSACTWALGSATYSKLVREYRPFDLNFTRAMIALPAFIVFVFLAHGGWQGGVAAYEALTRSHAGWLLLSVICSYAVGDVFFLWSTVSLGVPGALAIASGYPILTALLGYFFEGQAMSAIQWFGLAVAVFGIALVILNDPKKVVDGPAREGTEVKSHRWLKKKSVGVTLAIITAFAWATNSYSVVKGATGLHPAVANSLRMAISLGLIATLSLATTQSWVRPLPMARMRTYGWIFFVESFLGSLFFVYGLSHSSFALGATLSSLAPVLTVPIAVALKLERFSWVRAVAVLTVVVGLSLLFR